MDRGVDGVGAVKEEPAKVGAERMTELRMDGEVVGKEGALAAEGLVDDLVGHDEVPGPDLLFEAAHGAGTDNVGNPERFEGINVGPVGDSGGRKYVAFAVAGQQGNAYAGPFGKSNGPGGFAKGRFNDSLFALAVGGKGVSQAATSDYADH